MKDTQYNQTYYPFSGDWFQKRLYADFGWPVWDTWGSGYKYYMDSRVKGRRRDEEEDE